MKDLLRRPWFGPLVALVLVYALFAVASPDTFARPENLATMLRQTVVVAIASVGMTYVIVAGGIDLSVGSLVALTTVVVAKVLAGGASPLVAVAAGVALATVAGVVNGTLVAKLGITPFIVTLGTMSALRGAAKGIANEQKIDVQSAGLDTLMAPTSSVWLPPAGVWVAAVTALLFAGMLRYTVFGRHVVAIGSNEETARLCGIRVPRVTIWVYALAGALAGLAGLMEFSTLTVGDPTDSIGLELEVIAAVVIGGGSLAGGQGSIAGALVGALLMTTIKTGSTHVGLPNWVQEILTGAIIVLAVAIDRLRRRSSR
ncbi:MAG: ABC transporter permease [Polyangiaceae bacterium]|nr:ABC transporter permease [Polyangiaceae bacterium]